MTNEYMIHTHPDGGWAFRRKGAKRCWKRLENRPALLQFARAHLRRPFVLWVMTRSGVPDYVIDTRPKIHFEDLFGTT